MGRGQARSIDRPCHAGQGAAVARRTEPHRVARALGGGALALSLIGFPTAAAAAATRDDGAFQVKARSAGAFDPGSRTWLFEQAVDDTVPVASLTKIAAALTFVDAVTDLEDSVTVRAEDWTHAGRTRLRVGDRVPGSTLLRLALVSSDNCAARCLARPFGLDLEAFGLKMTLLARRLGCRSTVFVEPSGLDPRNRSTARDMAVLFGAALEDPLLREMLGTGDFVLDTPRGPRAMVHSAPSVRIREDVTAAKTGFTVPAGYCLIQAVSDSGGDFITVVLGATSKGRRTTESYRIIEHVRALRRGKL